MQQEVLSLAADRRLDLTAAAAWPKSKQQLAGLPWLESEMKIAHVSTFHVKGHFLYIVFAIEYELIAAGGRTGLDV